MITDLQTKIMLILSQIKSSMNKQEIYKNYSPVGLKAAQERQDTLEKLSEAALENSLGLAKVFKNLLYTAITFNLVKEVHELLILMPALELDTNDINQCLLEEERWESSINNKNLMVKKPYKNYSLLGLAAFHGHLDMVSYLIQVRHVDINAAGDKEGNKPLHQVVLGGLSPNSCNSFGKQHAAVARYLLMQGANLTYANRAEKTADVLANEFAPSCIASFVGIPYSTSSVRSILNEASVYKNRRYKTVMPKEESPSLESFSLYHEVDVSLQENTMSSLYPDKETFFRQLEKLTEQEWQILSLYLNQKSFARKYVGSEEIAGDSLSVISRGSFLIGIALGSWAYDVTGHAPFSLVVAVMVPVLLKTFWVDSLRISQETVHRKNVEKGIAAIQSHNRFFKSQFAVSGDVIEKLKASPGVRVDEQSILNSEEKMDAVSDENFVMDSGPRYK